jgi:serine/threonine protein kinase
LRSFGAALDVTAEARAGFLDRACAGDAELRREVEELLEAARAQTQGPLESRKLTGPPALANLHPSLQGLALAPGMPVGRYKLLRQLGQGGMGTVFLAHDSRLHRRVAIKFLHAATQEMTNRFLAEARATARCRHENIVVIHDVDELDGHPYMVLECLEGEPLRQRLAGLVGSDDTASATPAARRAEITSPAMPVADVLALVIPVVRALVCAHAHGFVHRDLKPENVFLCSDGTVKVLDFGIAKVLTDAHALGLTTTSPEALASTMRPQEHVITERGVLLGTLPYMSPEQWGTGEIDERTDIWAVGIMLYEMLAGRHPLAPLSYARLERLVPDPDTAMPAIGDALTGLGALASIVDGCLRKRPAERMASTQELLDALVQRQHTEYDPQRASAPSRTVGDRSGLPDGDAEQTAEITVVTGLLPALRAPAHVTQQKPSTPTEDPLAQALDDALARKQRLEAAGLPIAEVLDEIRKLKRELRLGGMLRPGDVLGHRYLLAEKIGQGGFGTVWRARERSTDEDVAVKVLHPNLAGASEHRQRFFRGARIMAELAHPAVVGVRQLEDEDDGFHYFVMNFLAGGNLYDAVLVQRLAREQILLVILQVGAALAAAHKRGIVHRDVKPSNILLDDESRPYLTDFDLVTAPDTTGGTRTGALGTFLYAPPEMLERPQEATARADVYGLGMTLAFMLYGGPLPHISLRDASRFVQSLACEASLHPVLARAVAWEPEERFASAEEFCQALHEIKEAHVPGKSKSPKPDSPTLHEFLQAIQLGQVSISPILVEVGSGVRVLAEDIEESRSTVSHSLLAVAEYIGREYSGGRIVALGSEPVPQTPVTIGRSRGCDVRIYDDSVSKVHAKLIFDTAHDGFNLYDLVSYNGKHNEANGHNNQDGTDDNRSWNCGWEGNAGAPPDVLALRKRQVKNFCCLLFLANGTPMFCAGEEFMHTQSGNNNPYNQDNEIT